MSVISTTDDFNNCSDLFDFHLFADDSNLFFSHSDLTILEELVNTQLSNVYKWLCANKLSLNRDKTNFVIFHPIQKKIRYIPKLVINQVPIKFENFIKYLGIYIDSHLNWKTHVYNTSKKIKRSIGMLSKI